MVLPSSRLIMIALMLIASLSTKGQSKLYLSAGVSNVFGSGLNIFLGQKDESLFKFNHVAFDGEYQTRVIGSLNFVTGLSVFSAGYNATDDSFSAASKFDATYVGTPLMVRWNIGNNRLSKSLTDLYRTGLEDDWNVPDNDSWYVKAHQDVGKIIEKHAELVVGFSLGGGG